MLPAKKNGQPPAQVAMGNPDAGYFGGGGGDLRRMFVEQGRQ